MAETLAGRAADLWLPLNILSVAPSISGPELQMSEPGGGWSEVGVTVWNTPGQSSLWSRKGDGIVSTLRFFGLRKELETSLRSCRKRSRAEPILLEI
jgi:hypothetical protein